MRNNLIRRQDDLLSSIFNDGFLIPNFTYGDNIDIYHEDGKYVVELNLPGFKKEEIDVKFTNDILSISAEHKEESKEEKEKNYFYRSRVSNSYRREIRFANVAPEGVDAGYENGVLKISLPEKDKEEPITNRIEVK